jgi:outer membrane protein OmpA-like peptidoglycan-associated protein
VHKNTNHRLANNLPKQLSSVKKQQPVFYMRLIPAAVLCALLGVVYWVGATIFTEKIQTDISERTNDAIAMFKPDVKLDVDGRDVTLLGAVSSPEQKAKAKQLVDDVWGVRASKDLLDVLKAYNFKSTLDENGQVTAYGTVDSSDAIKAIRDALPENSKITISSGASPLVNSGERLVVGAEALLDLQEGNLAIDKDKFVLQGTAPDVTAKQGIEDAIDRQKAIIEPLQVTLEIDVASPFTAACLALLDNVASRDMVLFDVDKAIVTEPYQQMLSSYAQLLQECPGMILLEAHADQDGSEQYNEALSNRRASAVANALVDMGVAEARIHTFAYGETRPIASNETTSDKTYNRRVELQYVQPTFPEAPDLNSIAIISSQSAE